MKAFGYSSNGGPEVQEFLELDEPTPLAGELLVEVRAAWKVTMVEMIEREAVKVPQPEIHIRADAETDYRNVGKVIAAINASPARVFAVDIPSGLDSDTGRPLGPTGREWL